VLPDGHADIYYLGLERDEAVFEQGAADELRHSFGARLWGKPGAWDYNSEAAIHGGGEDWRKKEVCRWEYEGIERRSRELGFRVEVFAMGDFGGDVLKLEGAFARAASVGCSWDFPARKPRLSAFIAMVLSSRD
jgi:hypothetical protein